MKELNKKIAGIRKMMGEMKTELYAIVNPDLAVLNEYTKNIYLKVLCTVVQYENEPTDMQILYLKRIVKGINVDEALEEYMRKALEISDVDIQEFFNLMKENSVKYFFALEGMLLVSMGKGEQSNYEYLAELIELCRITKKDLECLSLVAESILRQESSYYEEAKKIMTENVAMLCFAPYIENYYIGAIIDTQNEKYYLAPNREVEQHIEYPQSFTARKITFNNLNLEINCRWEFTGCETVKFVNCKLHNFGVEALYFRAIGRVQFENCEFVDFSRRIAYMNAVNEICVTNSKFSNCGYICDNYTRGGMFDLENIISFIFINNSVLNCYIEAKISVGISRVSGILLDANNKTQFIIKNNEFIGCQCINNQGDKPAIITNISGNKNIECSDNRCIGGVTTLCIEGY